PTLDTDEGEKEPDLDDCDLGNLSQNRCPPAEGIFGSRGIGLAMKKFGQTPAKTSMTCIHCGRFPGFC
ncbi:MAG: hypothetical protein Q6K80_06820, partial [Thermostichus sp. DG_1_6_bins_120]